MNWQVAVRQSRYAEAHRTKIADDGYPELYFIDAEGRCLYLTLHGVINIPLDEACLWEDWEPVN